MSVPKSLHTVSALVAVARFVMAKRGDSDYVSALSTAALILLVDEETADDPVIAQCLKQLGKGR